MYHIGGAHLVVDVVEYVGGCVRIVTAPEWSIRTVRPVVELECLM